MKIYYSGHIPDILISPDLPIFEAIKVLDAGALQIVLVVDKNNFLLGTVTDGDIRRGILRGFDLNLPISSAMNVHPVTISHETSRDKAQALMRARSIHCLPILNRQGIIVGLETENRLLWEGVENTVVVLMAGGLGMRLRPLTDSIPKPLLAINGTPIMQHIIERFAEQGFRRFFISVNYRAQMIKDYFGNGSAFGVDIDYLEESKRLGTGGALSLISGSNISENLLVMNGDLLTTLDFRQLLEFHRHSGGVATMAVREYSFRVPYGVVQVEGDSFINMIEKPAHTFFVNAGVYAIRYDQLGLIPKGEFFDLPDLFAKLRNNGEKVTVFPLREEWRDIGSHADYAEANQQLATGLT